MTKNDEIVEDMDEASKSSEVLDDVELDDDEDELEEDEDEAEDDKD